MTAVAFFVSAHGLGHAARTAAVIQALSSRRPGLRAELFTQAPRWFFEESLTEPFGYHHAETDVGLVQRTALHEDLDATLARLESFLPLDPNRIDQCAHLLERAGCKAVVSDIAPLGLAVARRAALPSVLIESFTWDWIYAGYLETCPGLQPFITALAEIYTWADLHLRTAPACDQTRPAREIGPISRPARVAPDRVRRELDMPEGRPLVLITMGGVPWRHESLEPLIRCSEAFFVVPGASEGAQRSGSLLTLPHHSLHYHPDLVNAADLVVGKIGYSTLAETASSGAGFLVVTRPRFRESEVLVRYATMEMGAGIISEEELRSHTWLDRIPEMAAPTNRRRSPSPGADQAAQAVLDLIEAGAAI